MLKDQTPDGYAGGPTVYDTKWQVRLVGPLQLLVDGVLEPGRKE
jgi:hypothetical protein